MSETSEPDLDIRLDRSLGHSLFILGLVAAIIGFGARAFSDGPARGNKYAFGVLGLIGLTVTSFGVYRLIDLRIKLSFATEGIRDHRTGYFVTWTQIRSVRLHYATHTATMYLDVSQPDSEVDIGIDVLGLEFTPQSIVEIVDRRRLVAIEAEKHEPEAVVQSLVSEITSDLKAGIPLSFAVRKAVARGLTNEAAIELVSLATNKEIVHCQKCGLDYHTSIEACGVCNGPLR